MSSSGVITKALIDLKRIANPETETILGIMIFEDIFIAVFLAVLSGVVLAEEATTFAIGASVLKALAFCLVLILIARKFSAHVDRIIDIKSEELFLLFLFSLVIITSAIAGKIGISEAIGAFLIGLVFSETAQAKRIEEKIMPLRDLFTAMFFFFFGMMIDFRVFEDVLSLLAVAIPLSILGKMLSGFTAAKMQGFSTKAAINVGCGTVARGEFSVILSNIGVSAGLISLMHPFTAAYVLALSILGVILMKGSGAIHALITTVRVLRR
jgi:CPA2 family monovalent cation:H+ antiporter-2